MKFAKFFAWSIVAVALMDAIGDALCAAQPGKPGTLALLCYLPGPIWLLVSLVELLTSLKAGLPFFLPVFYMASYLCLAAFGLVYAFMHPQDRGTVPLFICCIGWAWDLCLVVLSLKYLRSLGAKAAQ